MRFIFQHNLLFFFHKCFSSRILFVNQHKIWRHHPNFSVHSLHIYIYFTETVLSPLVGGWWGQGIPRTFTCCMMIITCVPTSGYLKNLGNITTKKKIFLTAIFLLQNSSLLYYGTYIAISHWYNSHQHFARFARWEVSGGTTAVLCCGCFQDLFRTTRSILV